MDLSKMYQFLMLAMFAVATQGQLFDFFSAFQPLITSQHATIKKQTDRPTTIKSFIKSQTTNLYNFNYFTTTMATPRRSTTRHIVKNDRNSQIKNVARNVTSRLNTQGSNRNNAKLESTTKNYLDYRITIKDNLKTNDTSYRPSPNPRNPNVSGLTPNLITVKPSTTLSPLLNRPGVKPAPVDLNRPAITNRPDTFTDHLDVSPGIEIGPDDELMTEGEKRRHLQVAERMCDKYKSMTTRRVEAIALLPSPRPVRVNVSECAPITIPLVVGGKPVSIREFPHMALVGWRKVQEAGYSWKCGGSLISDRFVLSAGHCSYQEKDDSVTIGPPQAVQLGSTYLGDSGAQVIRVASVIRHPKYKQPRSYYDIALLKLANTVTFSAVLRPACLGVVPAAGQPVIATGWGRTENGGGQSLELRSVSLPVWDMGECSRVLGTSRKLPNGPLAGIQMCAGDRRGGKDTCQGDSGGPAQVQDGCVWRVVGVTSLGRACGAPNTPGLYASAAGAFIPAVVFGGLDTNNNDRDTNINRDTNRPTQTNDFNRGQSNTRPTQSDSNNNWNNNWQGNDGNNNRQTQSNDFNRGQSNRPTQSSDSNNNWNNNWQGNDGNNNRPTQSNNFNRGQSNTRPTQSSDSNNNWNNNWQGNDGNNNRPTQSNNFNRGQSNRPTQNSNSNNNWGSNDNNNNINRPTQSTDFNRGQSNTRPTQSSDSNNNWNINWQGNDGINNNRPTQSNNFQNNNVQNTNDRIVFTDNNDRPSRKPVKVVSEKPWWLG